MSYSSLQYKSLAISPHFTAAMSIIGSLTMLYDILKSGKIKKFCRLRILAAISCVDILSSSSYFMSTWPIPKDLVPPSNAYAVIGNKGTCQAQGFMIQMGITSVFYNLMLAVVYVLMIKFDKSEGYMKKIELWMHLIAIGWGMASSISALVLDLYHESTLWCWIGNSPFAKLNGDENGGNYKDFRWIFFYGPLWVCIGSITILMLILYKTVHAQDIKVRRFSSVSTTRRISKRSRNIAYQCIAFSAAFYITWTPATIARVYQFLGFKTSYSLMITMAIVTPVQGFLNSLVYFRPRIVNYMANTYYASNFSRIFSSNEDPSSMHTARRD